MEELERFLAHESKAIISRLHGYEKQAVPTIFGDSIPLTEAMRAFRRDVERVVLHATEIILGDIAAKKHIARNDLSRIHIFSVMEYAQYELQAHRIHRHALLFNPIDLAIDLVVAPPRCATSISEREADVAVERLCMWLVPLNEAMKLALKVSSYGIYYVALDKEEKNRVRSQCATIMSVKELLRKQSPEVSGLASSTPIEIPIVGWKDIFAALGLEYAKSADNRSAIRYLKAVNEKVGSPIHWVGKQPQVTASDLRALRQSLSSNAGRSEPSTIPSIRTGGDHPDVVAESFGGPASVRKRGR